MNSKLLFTDPIELGHEEAELADPYSKPSRKEQRAQRRQQLKNQLVEPGHATKNKRRHCKTKTTATPQPPVGDVDRYDSTDVDEPNRKSRRNNKAPKTRHKRLPGGELRDISTTSVETEDRPKKTLIQRRERQVLKLPMHRATTAHSRSIFPFGVHEAFGHTGAYLGQDSLGGGGAFFFDAFEAATRFAESDGVTNPNMMIFGNPGMGKSALLKTMLLRSVAIYGEQRFVAIVDVKGEYTPLAQVLGLPVVKLSPGGIVRVNPLEVRTRDEDRVMRQHEMVQALSSATLGRRLTQVEDVFLWESVRWLDHTHINTTATLGHLVELLRNPHDHIINQLQRDRLTILEETADVQHAISSLLERQFRGMFDGESSVDIDPNGPGVVIDISTVQDDARALPLVMVAAITWLRELLTAASGKKLQVLDEAWRMLEYEAAARYLQSSWKLGRQKGLANIAAFHRPSNLASQANDGTATSKIAHSLIADSAIIMSFQQSADDLFPSGANQTAYAELLGWNTTQADTITGLGRGQSLWRIGKRSVLLNHKLATEGIEPWLCDTNAAMR